MSPHLGDLWKACYGFARGPVCTPVSFSVYSYNFEEANFKQHNLARQAVGRLLVVWADWEYLG